jgi:hypothetical protein
MIEYFLWGIAAVAAILAVVFIQKQEAVGFGDNKT